MLRAFLSHPGLRLRLLNPDFNASKALVKRQQVTSHCHGLDINGVDFYIRQDTRACGYPVCHQVPDEVRLFSANPSTTTVPVRRCCQKNNQCSADPAGSDEVKQHSTNVIGTCVCCMRKF